MYESLGCVEAGVVIGPDTEWADRVEDLLSHKGDVWRWQNAECLRTDLGLEVRYYVLHRHGFRSLEPAATLVDVYCHPSGRIAVDVRRTRFADVTEWER